MELSPMPHCATCQATTTKTTTKSLLRFASCRVVFYCSWTHQQAHWPTHKGACTSIKKATKALGREEAVLRALPGHWPAPPGDHTFSPQYVEQFWALVESLLEIKTYAEVEAAHGHVMDILRLSASDDIGGRSTAPGLKLRLRNREAEAYDFCKTWMMADNDETLDGIDCGSIRGGKEDVMESPKNIFVGETLQLSCAVAVTLIKVRLLLDVRALRDLRMAGLRKKVPAEIEEIIRKELVCTSVIAGRRDIIDGTAEGVAEDLEGQVGMLIKAVEKYNPSVWPVLRMPGRHMETRPAYYSRHSWEEAQMQLQFSYDAWAEIEGAFAVLDADDSIKTQDT